MNTFYHACNSVAECINIINFTELKSNDNGLGFYCSEDREVAERYGAYIITIMTDQCADITRPITNDPSLTCAQQMDKGMESVFVTVASAQGLFVDADLVIVQRGDTVIPGIA